MPKNYLLFLDFVWTIMDSDFLFFSENGNTKELYFYPCSFIHRIPSVTTYHSTVVSWEYRTTTMEKAHTGSSTPMLSQENQTADDQVPSMGSQKVKRKDVPRNFTRAPTTFQLYHLIPWSSSRIAPLITSSILDRHAPVLILYPTSMITMVLIWEDTLTTVKHSGVHDQPPMCRTYPASVAAWLQPNWISTLTLHNLSNPT